MLNPVSFTSDTGRRTRGRSKSRLRVNKLIHDGVALYSLVYYIDFRGVGKLKFDVSSCLSSKSSEIGDKTRKVYIVVSFKVHSLRHLVQLALGASLFLLISFSHCFSLSVLSVGSSSSSWP